MKNILSIFKNDLTRIRKNTIAIIVIIGLTIVPSLYAWFNIAASWDPYASTGAIKVAVASDDKGYEGDIFPLKISIGDMVISKLRENTQLEWVFTKKDSALEGVKSGDYYAAIVIPESFTNDMMSIFSENITHSQIQYYFNEKENAIAPKITEKGAGALSKEIDESFAKTITEVTVGVSEGLSDYIRDENKDGKVKKAVISLSKNLYSLSEDLVTAEKALNVSASLTDMLASSLQDISDIIGKSSDLVINEKQILHDSERKIDGLIDETANIVESVEELLVHVENYYRIFENELDKIFSDTNKDKSFVIEALSDIKEKFEKVNDMSTNIRNEFERLRKVSDTYDTGSVKTLETIASKMDVSIDKQNKVIENFNKIISELKSGSCDMVKAEEKLKSLIKTNIDEIIELQKDYNTEIKSQLAKVFASIKAASGSMISVIAGVQNIATSTLDATNEGIIGLRNTNKSLDETAAFIHNTRVKMEEISEKLKLAASRNDMETIANILKSDPTEVGSFVSSPVKINTIKIYPVENYGSAMAPFYSSLAIWVGGIILVAMIKVNVNNEQIKKMESVRLYQMYFGRMLLFIIIGILQSVLICTGDLFYLGIQCRHPILFMITGIFTSIVFVNFIYTMTISFGDIGKAICVILLVIQIAGSGGTFPVEMTPEIFQKIYNFLPFTHSMGAMRECIAGLYGNKYIYEMLSLSLIMIFSLTLGLFLRKPLMSINEKFNEKLEETHLM